MNPLSAGSRLNEMLAERFQALAEPARLRLLSALGDRERTVSELVDSTGLGQANVSRHLQHLRAMKFVTRRKDGLHVRYRVADRGVLRLCQLACAPARRPPSRRRATAGSSARSG